jgi:hypothetical protein
MLGKKRATESGVSGVSFCPFPISAEMWVIGFSRRLIDAAMRAYWFSINEAFCSAFTNTSNNNLDFDVIYTVLTFCI